MAENSKIEWTDHTFNPWRGCTKVHEGCAHCYAETLSKRNPSTLGVWGPAGERVVAAESYWRQPLKWNREAEREGVRRRVFCASLADVFEDWPGIMRGTGGGYLHHAQRWQNVTYVEISDIMIGRSRVSMNDVRRRMFALIDATPNLDWLLLTKRPENILRMWPRREDYAYVAEAGALNDYPMYRRENVWLGTSVSLQVHADKQVPALLESQDLCPVRFLSIEPMLGPVDLTGVTFPHGGRENVLHCATSERAQRAGIDRLNGINWVIVGGESGPGARPMHPAWVHSLRDQCQAAGVPYFFKQWGEWLPAEEYIGPEWRGTRIRIDRAGREVTNLPGLWDCTDAIQYRVGKKSSGRLLDGREWSQFPDVAESVSP